MLARDPHQSTLSPQRRTLIASDRPPEGAILLEAAKGAPACSESRLERIPLTNLWRRADLGPDDLVLIATDRAADAAGLARWGRLSRSIALVFVVPRDNVVGWEAVAVSRSVGVVAREDLDRGALETAIRALTRARESERVLIDIISARNRVLSTLRAASEHLHLVESDLMSRLRRAPADPALAGEAILALAEVEARFASAFADADADRPTDLIALVDALVRPGGIAIDANINALTSEGPLWLEAPARETQALLRELLARWRGSRAEGDRLELIVWDAGESARIAAVFSRANPAASKPSLARVTSDLIGSLQPFARACGARIEEVGEPRGRVERTSFAIDLVKRGVGPGRSLRRGSARARDSLGDDGDPRGKPRGVAG